MLYSSKKPIQGLISHGLLALSDKGIPLGIVHQEFIDRKGFKANGRLSKSQYQRLPISEKESIRWLSFIEKSQELDTGPCEVIHVADREGDIYELYRDCTHWGENFLIRASHNRTINKNKRRQSRSEKLFDTLEASKAQGTVSVKVHSSKKGRKYRKVKLSIIYKTVSIPPPPNRTMKNSDFDLPMVEMTAIMAIERKPPKGESPIKWTLLTNLEVGSVDSAIDKVSLYSMRWNIELLHKIIKSGFGVEKCQMQDGEKLKKYITLKSILAWRIFWMTRTLDISKEKTCESVLTDFEWKVLYKKFNKSKKLPKRPPTVNQVYIWIGKLGGFIGRSGDGTPGFISIWRGWTRFMDLLEDYEAFCG